jgi:hypothetical protein
LEQENLLMIRSTLILTTFAVAVAATAGSHDSVCRAETLYGLTNFQELVVFDSATRAVSNTATLAGFSIVGERLLSIDVRPATGELYGLSNQDRLFRINPITGASSLVGAGLGASLSGDVRAIDFNPTVDRVRIVTSSGQNFRAHPDTGAIVFTDMPLMFKAGDANEGDTPAVVSAAYTNSVAGAASTVLYDIEAGNDLLVSQAPPNDGKLNSIGSGLGFDAISSSNEFTGFDISGATGVAYLTRGNGVFGSEVFLTKPLYTVNLTTGLATLAGPVTGFSGTLRDIAVAPVPEASTAALALVASAAGFVARRRRERT